MEHYTRTKLVAKALDKYIDDTHRPDWISFCRIITLTHGVRRKFIEKLLAESYPGLTIENDVLVRPGV